METNYAAERLTTAIKNHLLTVDAMPPSTEVPRLAGELAQVCLSELNTVGVATETIDHLFAPAIFKTFGRGAD